MKRVTPFLALILFASCAPVSDDSPPATTKRVVTDDMDFSGYPAATEQPYAVSPAAATLCAPAVSREEVKRHGPHYKPAIVVRANPESIDAFRNRVAPMPAGTVVVKEKHSQLDAKDAPAELGVMIKREAGYDPEHGDWEYLFITREPEKKVTRGKLLSCIECHATVKSGDFLFRTYFPSKSAESKE